jgi:hypothetical protein
MENTEETALPGEISGQPETSAHYQKDEKTENPKQVNQTKPEKAEDITENLKQLQEQQDETKKNTEIKSVKKTHRCDSYKKQQRSMRNTNLFIFCTLMTAACTILRTMQYLLGFIDESGLYVFGKTAENAMPFWLLGVTLIGSIIISLTENRKITPVFRRTVSNTRRREIMFCGIVFILSGLVFIIGAAKTSDIAYMLCSAGFLGSGLAIFLQKRIVPLAGFLMFFPGIGYAVSAISTFSEDYVITKTPLQLTLFLSNLICAVFFLLLGKVLSRNDNKWTRIRLASFGAAAVAAILSETLSGVFLYLYSDSSTGKIFTLLPNIQLTFTAISIITVLAVLSLKPALSGNLRQVQ